MNENCLLQGRYATDADSRNCTLDNLVIHHAMPLTRHVEDDVMALHGVAANHAAAVAVVVDG